MYEPWWVPRNSFTGDESEPISMQSADLWFSQPLNEQKLNYVNLERETDERTSHTDD